MVKANSVQKTKSGDSKPYFVATSQNESECPHFDNRRLARAAAKNLREGKAIAEPSAVADAPPAAPSTPSLPPLIGPRRNLAAQA
jgi:hypothetical protein